MRTAKAQDSDDVLTSTSNMTQHHFGGDGDDIRSQRKALASKESSMVTACGYNPTQYISDVEWQAMKRRDDRMKTADGKYRESDVYLGENKHPRYV